MVAGQIVLEGIECQARIGVSRQERAQYQPLEVSVEMHFPAEPAINTDSLDLSIDYEAVVALIQEEVANKKCALLETMAAHVCALVLRNPRVEKVEVEVRKSPASLQGRVRKVAVRLSRGHFS